MALTGVAFVVEESAKDLAILQVRGHSQPVKRGDDVRSGMICFLLEGFKVNGAIAAVYIGTSAQRDGGMRSVGGRNHKKDGKDCGEREMHLVEAS
jgi:hypothetical protein